MKIKFKLGENAKLPEQNNKTDAGYDLFSAENKVIPSKSRIKIDTNVSWEPLWDAKEIEIVRILNLGVFMDIRDRSGNAFKLGLTKMAGVVDYSYRGNIGVVLYNTSDEDIEIHIGDKIAQAIFTPCFHPEKIEISDTLNDTERGGNGYGSSGVIGG